MPSPDASIAELVERLEANGGCDNLHCGDSSPCHECRGCYMRQAATALTSLNAEVARLKEERDAALYRLGALGVSVSMPDDLSALIARLATMGSYGHKPYPTHFINPDGPDAVAAIETLNTKLTAAEDIVAKLEAEYDPPRFKEVVGDAYQPAVHGKHSAAHPKYLRELLVEHKDTATADAIAVLIWQREIAENRAQFVIETALERATAAEATVARLEREIGPPARRGRVMIVAAAIKYGSGVLAVPAPGRHHDVIRLHHEMTGLPTKGDAEQGFLDSGGRFVDRTEAARIAIRYGQAVAERMPIPGYLFSEDVW